MHGGHQPAVRFAGTMPPLHATPLAAALDYLSKHGKSVPAHMNRMAWVAAASMSYRREVIATTRTSPPRRIRGHVTRRRRDPSARPATHPADDYTSLLVTIAGTEYQLSNFSAMHLTRPEDDQ